MAAVGSAESTYGSDKAGMVCGYAFRPMEPGRAVDSDRAGEWLAVPSDGHEFLWLHFNLSNAASERWLKQHLRLPDAFDESLRAQTSTRVEGVGDALLAVINDVQYFTIDASNVSSVTVWVEARVLLTARSTPLRSVERLRSSVKRGDVFRSPVDVLAHLLRDQAEVLMQIVRDVTTEVDTIEDKLLGRKVMASRSKLGALRRTLVRLQRLLAPEPAALFRLLNRPPTWITADDVRDLRQAAEELSAAVTDSVALVERVRLLQEELGALVNEQTNRTLFVLTVVTVLALPMTIIPGLFGMNVGGVPFGEHPAGFWLVLLIVAMVAGAGAYFALRTRNPD
jgi:zinc transporter